MKKIGAVINKNSGTLPPKKNQKRLEEIEKLLQSRVWQKSLAIVEGYQVKKEAKRMVQLGIDQLVVGGGDGSISAAASLLADTDISLAVLPMGTRNHFARDLNLPLEMEENINLLDQNHTRLIDLGEVNGNIFINNATLGLYPQIVREREKKTDIEGWQKWRAHLTATWTVLRRFPRMRLSLEGNQFRIKRFSLFLFIGNNAYERIFTTDSFRPTLNGGRLWLCMAKSAKISSLIRTLLQFITKGFQGAEQLETHFVTEITVDSWKRKITVAVDGETLKLRTPLHFNIRRDALRVVIP